MRLPNGFGSVYKLSGNRRNPWAARKTTGWTYDESKGQSRPIYQFVGYYPTRQEALIALSDYNKDPYDLQADKMTLQMLYDKWSVDHYEQVSQSNVQGCKAAWKLLAPIKDMNVHDIKLIHLQHICDTSGKNAPTLKKLKIILGLMYDYAVKYEVLDQSKRDMIRYIDIRKAGNPNALDRKPFTQKEIKTLWDTVETDEYYQIPLILIYTGLRVGEFWELKKEDVHLDEKWFYVRKSKTAAGIREVPIADKIMPFFEHWMKKEGEYAFAPKSGGRFLDRNFRDAYWKPLMETLGMKHLPHDTRHTCVSLLASAGVDQVLIRKIVGHAGQNVTENVYTHLEMPIKLEAINKI